MEIEAKYFIFDMDGLMIDSEKLAYNIWKEEMEKDGYELSLDFYKSMIGIPDNNMIEKFYSEYGKNFDFNKYSNKYQERRDIIYNTIGVDLKLGVIEILNYLKNNNKKLAVATSSCREIVDVILKKNNIYNYFDYFVTCEDVENHKPEPDVFLKAIDLANIKKEDSIIFEDSENGLKAAYKANIRSIFIKDMVEPSREVLDTIYYRAESLVDVIKFIK